MADLSRATTSHRVDCDAPVALWLVDLSRRPPGEALSWLTPEERARASRFHFDRDRRRYLAAHVSLRLVIGQTTGLAPAEQRHEWSDLGKPHLADAPDWRFNMSYADDIALIGIARDREVGVDVETYRTVDDAADLASPYCSEAERRDFAGGQDPSDTFLVMWTRKEACMKALGTGLHYPAAMLVTGTTECNATLTAGGIPLRVGSLRPREGLIAAWSIMDAAR